MDDLQLVASNSLRPPDWRYRLGRSLADGGRFPPRWCDQIIRTIVRYLQLRSHQRTVAACDLAAGEFREIHVAFQIREASASRLRAGIEAAILADEAPDATAIKWSVSADSIRWYEAAFFDVRSRLAASAFILHQLIEDCRRQNPDDWCDYTWKLLGFLGGGEALEQTMGLTKVTSLEQLLPQLQQETRLILQEKVRRVVQELSPENPGAVAQLLRAVEGNGRKSSGESAPSDMQKNIQAMLQSLPFQVAEPFEEFSEATREFDKSAVDLNGSELMALGAGFKLPYADVLLKMKFPEPAGPGMPGQT